jgi:hypothetical protein
MGFYTSDVEESAQRINCDLPHDTPYPIEISADMDTDWSEYRGAKSRFNL